MKKKYKEFKKENCLEKRNKRKEQVGKKFETKGKNGSYHNKLERPTAKEKILKTLLTELQSWE